MTKQRYDALLADQFFDGTQQIIQLEWLIQADDFFRRYCAFSLQEIPYWKLFLIEKRNTLEICRLRAARVNSHHVFSVCSL